MRPVEWNTRARVTLFWSPVDGFVIATSAGQMNLGHCEVEQAVQEFDAAVSQAGAA